MTQDNGSNLLRQTGVLAENAMDYVQRRLATRLKPDQLLHIIAYRGFGASDGNG